jgi:thiamine biosynthesis protein ThiS
MQVQLNGERILLSHSQTLAVFLKGRSIEQQTAGVAVAVNGQIVFRSDWTSRKVKEGDQIEIVHAVSGG